MSPGWLDTLQGGSLKSTGAGHHYVPKDEPAGKKADKDKTGALAGTQEKKKRDYDL